MPPSVPCSWNLRFFCHHPLCFSSRSPCCTPVDKRETDCARFFLLHPGATYDLRAVLKKSGEKRCTKKMTRTETAERTKNEETFPLLLGVAVEYTNDKGLRFFPDAYLWLASFLRRLFYLVSLPSVPRTFFSARSEAAGCKETASLIRSFDDNGCTSWSRTDLRECLAINRQLRRSGAEK